MQELKQLAKIQIPRSFIEAAIKIYPIHLTYLTEDAKICDICNTCCCRHQNVYLTVLGEDVESLECAVASTNEDISAGAVSTHIKDNVTRSTISEHQAMNLRNPDIQRQSTLVIQYKYEQQRYQDAYPVPIRGKHHRANRFRQELPICKFCRSNGETKAFYSGHQLMENGIVSCPILRTFICPICKASGDTAHTLKYCPDIPLKSPHEYIPVRNAYGKFKTLKY